MKYKILVLGDVNGEIETALAKVAAHHQKQNFAFAIVAGNLFASDEHGVAKVTDDVDALLKGRLRVPLPVFFTLGRQILPARVIRKLDRDDGELCINLFALSRRGRVKTKDGITITAISGIHHPDDMLDDAECPKSWYTLGYTDEEASNAISFGRADILITSDWPKDITVGSNRLSSDAGSKENAAIAKVCAAIKPRYHFSASEKSFEREQFYHDTKGYPVTNFLSLAPFGSPAGQKALFAFSLEVPQPALESPPVGVAKAPFRSGKSKRGLATQDDAFNEYRYSNGSQLEDHRGKRRKKNGPVMPDECFFCLSNPKVEDHLVAAVGEHSYVTVPKGPLPKDDTFPDLGFPGHLLVIPTNHTPTLAAIADERERASLKAEMERFRSAIQRTLATKSDESKLGTVSWEVSRAGNVHLHWQVMAMPADLIDNGSIEKAFQEEAATKHYPPFETAEDKIAAVEEANCFKVELWSESSSKKIALPLDETFKFNLQFGRAVLGKLLGLSARADWKSCGQSKASEEADVATFRGLFKELDFTQDEA